MPARSRAWMPGCKPISMMACTAEGARSLPASEVRMKPSSRTSLREKSRRLRFATNILANRNQLKLFPFRLLPGVPHAHLPRGAAHVAAIDARRISHLAVETQPVRHLGRDAQRQLDRRAAARGIHAVVAQHDAIGAAEGAPQVRPDVRPPLRAPRFVRPVQAPADAAGQRVVVAEADARDIVIEVIHPRALVQELCLRFQAPVLRHGERHAGLDRGRERRAVGAGASLRFGVGIDIEPRVHQHRVYIPACGTHAAPLTPDTDPATSPRAWV
ncbi:hypothetical protein G6F65_017781 [Rhizopus arrhizus]|nr:hypothetical protein G6F65_017781 [Rhizopus arrhizus]